MTISVIECALRSVSYTSVKESENIAVYYKLQYRWDNPRNYVYMLQILSDTVKIYR